MPEPEPAPDWVTKDVLPHVQGTVRSVNMVTDRSVLVFTQDHALLGEKKTMGGVKLYRVDYPQGLVVNGAKCPHCGTAILEPIGKVARLASETPPAPVAVAEPEPRTKKAKKGKGKK